MPTNKLPKKGLVDSIIYLTDKYNRIERQLCCSNPSGGGIQSIVAGDGISINNDDPQNPIVSATGAEPNPPNLLIVATNSTGGLIDGSANVVTRALTGYSVGTNAAIVATDTILQAFGKTQAQLNNKQALSSELTSLAGQTGTGILVRTAANTHTTRSISGTTNRISVTNANGVSGNITFDVGSDIVTLTGAQTITNKSLTSPSLTGIPTAPTATSGTNTIQIATTAFVQSAITTVNSKILSVSSILDFPDTNGGDSYDLTISVPGAIVGDPVFLGTPNSAVFPGVFYYAWVSDNDVVTIRFINVSLLSVDPPSATFKVAISKF